MTGVNIEGVLINLGAAAAQGVALASLLTIFNLHTHLYSPGPGAVVATATPLPIAVIGTDSSLTVKAQL